MKKKIVITGGLGYLGTELCKLYSGTSWKHDITVIDNRFLSERINELKNWNIKFIQGGILDKNLINKELSDADVVHHLAGITDVAYVHNDINIERDDERSNDSYDEEELDLCCENSCPYICEINRLEPEPVDVITAEIGN